MVIQELANVCIYWSRRNNYEAQVGRVFLYCREKAQRIANLLPH